MRNIKVKQFDTMESLNECAERLVSLGNAAEQRGGVRVDSCYRARRLTYLATRLQAAHIKCVVLTHEGNAELCVRGVDGLEAKELAEDIALDYDTDLHMTADEGDDAPLWHYCACPSCEETRGRAIRAMMRATEVDLWEDGLPEAVSFPEGWSASYEEWATQHPIVNAVFNWKCGEKALDRSVQLAEAASLEQAARVAAEQEAFED